MKISISKLFGTLFLLISFGGFSQNNEKQERFQQHIETLEYMSRKTDNSKYYLDLALVYCDSLEAISTDRSWLESQRKKIELTLGTCEQNMNHKVELFPFFSGFPSYMGFADDAIEYAYDDALNTLFETTYPSIQRGPIKDASVTSILTRDVCDDEMFEIIRQTIISSTKHYLIPYDRLAELLGDKGAQSLTNGSKNDSLLRTLCEDLNLNKIGIFNANDIDNIDDKIFYVHTTFQTYSPSDGFGQPIFAKGFCEDKIGKANSVPLLLLESILLISLLSFFEEQIYRWWRRRKFSISESFDLLKNRFTFTVASFILPSILSFVMVYAVSFMMPEGPDHYMESSSIFWVLALTIGMSLIPLGINLFIVNRMGIDGFHTFRGYRNFANASIYASYLPFFVFYLIYFESYPRSSHLIMILISFAIADILANSYYQYSSDQKFRNIKIHAIFGLLLGTISLFLLNLNIFSELSVDSILYCALFVVPIVIIHRITGIVLNKSNEKTQSSSMENELLNELEYLKSVLDPKQKIVDVVMNTSTTDSMFIGMVNAPMGIGKTRLLKFECPQYFNDADYDIYYGDCDEVQDENSVSFEPFLEAFKDLLKVSSFTDRSSQMEDTIGSGIQSLIEEVSPVGGFIGEAKMNTSNSMIDMAIEIVEKLEKKGKKCVFVLEDLHWIDAESLAFLKCFLKAANRSNFLRKNMSVLLSIRSDHGSSIRGVDYQQLQDLLEELNAPAQKQGLGIDIQTILIHEDFNMHDFVQNLSEHDNKFALQKESTFNINELINSELNNGQVKDGPQLIITPLYVLKVLEKWISDGTLIHTPEGYLLSRQIFPSDLPNTNEIDSFYHQIIDNYESQWKRLLESAAIIGNKFNAEVLAQVWDYELLSVLTFLESAEKDGLVTDLSDEDNVYQFNDKRISSAIKSYFETTGDVETKQIVLEYNKRYLSIQKERLLHPHLYTLEELLMVARRTIYLIKSPSIRQKTQRLYIDLLIRMIDHGKFQEIEAFCLLMKEKGEQKISDLISILGQIADEDTKYDELKRLGALLTAFQPSDELEREFKIIGLMYYLRINPSEGNGDSLLSNDDWNFFKERLFTTHEGESLIRLSELYVTNVQANFEEKEQIIRELESHLEKDSSQSIDFQGVSLRMILDHSNPNKYDLNELSQNYFEDACSTGSVKQISRSFLMRIEILSNFVDDKNGAIDFYQNHEHLLITNQPNLQWVEATLQILNSHAGKYYVQDHTSEAQEKLNTIETFIYARNDEESFNMLIKRFINAKLTYLHTIDDMEGTREICERYLQIIESELSNTHEFYGEILIDYSKYFENKKNYDEMFNQRLKYIQIFEKLYAYKPEKYRRKLKSAYNNIAMRYRNKINDLEKSLSFSEKAMNISNPSDGAPHGISIFQVARVYSDLNNHEKAFELYQEAYPFFEDSTSSQRFKKTSLELNMSYSHSFIDKKKAKKEIQEAIKKLESKDLEKFVKEGTKKRIEEVRERLKAL